MVKVVSFVLLFVIASTYTYVLGRNAANDKFSTGLAETQAMFSFNHLKRYEELATCLDSGNVKAASTKINMSIVSEKELISEFLNSYNSDRINEYISIRYPKGVEHLLNFKSNRGSSWSEPKCL